MRTINEFYVYRFTNRDGKIVYVGRTTNLARRFLNHEHLTDDIRKIEYIKCATAADMAWKEIYYINFFANEDTTNTAELYSDGVTDLHLDDEWKTYSRRISNYMIDEERILANQDLIKEKVLISKIPLIHILDHERLNSIGDGKYALTRKWFYDDSNQKDLIQLGKHVTNYFRNICKAKSNECLWTTYDEMVPLISGKTFRKGFISLNEDAASDRIYLAFLCNPFYPIGQNSTINEDDFALSELLQFIWRSAIRNGKDISLYVPSNRMRNLLKRWIKQNTKK